MAIRISTMYHYSDEDNFIMYNPWFQMALENRISHVYESGRLREKIRSEMSDQFPTLWRNHMTSEAEYRALVGRLSSAADTGVARVQAATETKISEMMDAGQLESIKNNVFNTAMSKYNGFQAGLHDSFKANERDRNERLAVAEKEISSLRGNQVWTVLGGMVLGIGMGVFGMSKL